MCFFVYEKKKRNIVSQTFYLHVLQTYQRKPIAIRKYEFDLVRIAIPPSGKKREATVIFLLLTNEPQNARRLERRWGGINNIKVILSLSKKKLYVWLFFLQKKNIQKVIYLQTAQDDF